MFSELTSKLQLTLIAIKDMGDYDPFDPNADQTKKGWLTAILELGAWLGTLMSGPVAEIISRKYAILVASSVFILGVLIQVTSISGGHNSILGGRFITYGPPQSQVHVPEMAGLLT